METSSEQERYITIEDWTGQLGVSLQTGYRWVEKERSASASCLGEVH